MPKEFDFMKSAKDKEMSEEEYKSLRGEYDKKANDLSGRIKKLVLAFLAIYAVSFAILYIRLTFGGGGDMIGGFMFIAVEFLLAVFLYDPKIEEDKKQRYETDKKILLNSVKRKISMSKIRLGLVIGFGALFLILNIVWWMVFGFVHYGESMEDTGLRLIITQILNLCA